MNETLTRTYKRSQLEQAFSMLDYQLREGQISPVLKSNIRRLLDTDRATRPEQPEFGTSPMAFSEAVEPGQGAEVGYSASDAFILLIGIRLLEGGVPQRRVVALLRRIREPLEKSFGAIASVSRAQLQEQGEGRPRLTAVEAEQRVRDGIIISDPERMTFLIELAGQSSPEDLSTSTESGQQDSICSREQLTDRLRYISHIGRAAMVIELANAAHQLIYFLPHTTVRKRGRA